MLSPQGENDDEDSPQSIHADSDESIFSIGIEIPNRERPIVVENPHGGREVDAMLALIRRRFLGVPSIASMRVCTNVHIVKGFLRSGKDVFPLAILAAGLDRM